MQRSILPHVRNGGKYLIERREQCMPQSCGCCGVSCYPFGHIILKHWCMYDPSILTSPVQSHYKLSIIMKIVVHNETAQHHSTWFAGLIVFLPKHSLLIFKILYLSRQGKISSFALTSEDMMLASACLWSWSSYIFAKRSLGGQQGMSLFVIRIRKVGLSWYCKPSPSLQDPRICCAALTSANPVISVDMSIH